MVGWIHELGNRVMGGGELGGLSFKVRQRSLERQSDLSKVRSREKMVHLNSGAVIALNSHKSFHFTSKSFSFFELMPPHDGWNNDHPFNLTIT